jgi:hypothetical protein
VKLSNQQAAAISSAVWLVGIGVLIVTGWWWPGIMFLIGISAIVQGFVVGPGWFEFQWGLWALGTGVWALLGYNILVLFCLIALSGLLAAFAKPPKGLAQEFISIIQSKDD